MQRSPTFEDPAADHRGEISLDWLIRLRWGAAAGECALIAAAQALFGGLALARLGACVAALVITNGLLIGLRPRIRRPRLVSGVVLTLDTLLLSALLHAAGGANNPFSVLYLVHIALSAVVLGSRWTWFLAALAIGCYGLLFVVQPPMTTHVHASFEMNMHLRGMWVAFVVAASLTAYFVVRLSAAIERRDAAIAEMRERVARHERLASVTTLAAGAAHELGTPLATIAVAAAELQHAIERLPSEHAAPLRTDAGLIRAELDRCRAILNRLSGDAGQTRGEAPEPIAMATLAHDVVQTLLPSQRGRVRTTCTDPDVALSLPRSALQQVAHNLLANALDASAGDVQFALETQATRLRLVVRDDGPGMHADVLRRVGEPFFSTKPPGAGLGLGVFIARSLSEQMGAQLTLVSEPGHGTTATVELDTATLARGGMHVR
jgi:two-component system sensor histidine kinase RegB